MDICRVFTIQYIVFLLINYIHCITECDCNENKAQIAWIQKDYTQLKLEMRQENFKIVSRLRRLERAKEAISSDPPTTEGSSKSGADLEQNKHKMDVKLAQTADHLERIDKIEDKIVKIEEQLEVTNRNEASFINITAQMNEMDSKFVTVTSQVNDIRDFRNVISKTIHAEKTGRHKFHSNIRNQLENTEHLFSDFKAETINLVHNLSVPLYTKYETFTEEITRRVSEVKDQINTNISLELDDLTNVVSQMKSKISALKKITIEDKTDGAWGSWGGWSPCSVTCGGGIRWKTRTCTQPKPALQGNYCDGTPIQISVCNKQTCPGLKVAFTAYGSGTETTYTVITFPSTHFNSGGAYNTSTGRFTCEIPGIYHFAVTLTKIRKNVDVISAYIRINGDNKLQLFTDPYDSHDFEYGSYSLSAAGTFHLNVDDYVDVRGLPSYFYNSVSSFFTGFLVIPDT